MSIKIENVEYIAKLAKLDFNEQEKKQFQTDLSKILDYVEKLNELDTTDVEPLSHTLEIVNVLRKDVVKESLSVDDALKNAPAKSEGFFKVPKVIQ